MKFLTTHRRTLVVSAPPSAEAGVGVGAGVGGGHSQAGDPILERPPLIMQRKHGWRGAAAAARQHDSDRPRRVVGSLCLPLRRSRLTGPPQAAAGASERPPEAFGRRRAARSGRGTAAEGTLTGRRSTGTGRARRQFVAGGVLFRRRRGCARPWCVVCGSGGALALSGWHLGCSLVRRRESAALDLRRRLSVRSGRSEAGCPVGSE